MSRLWVVVLAIWVGIGHQVCAGDRENLFQEVSRGLGAIPLLDGKNVFGQKILPVSTVFQCERLDSERRHGFQVHGELTHKLRDPIKEKHWYGDDLYTPEDILKVLQELASRANRMNVSAIAFFRDVLEIGSVYGVQIPGLQKQPERTKVFTELYNIRARVDVATHPGKVSKVRERLIAEEEAQQVAARAAAKARELQQAADEIAAAQQSPQEGMVLRRRKPSWAMENPPGGDAYGVASDKEPLLPVDQK